MRFVSPSLSNRRRRRNGGFTLIEVGMAVVIIGVAFTAMLQLLATGTISNKEGTELTTAINLAGNIHEAAVRVAYDDLFTLEGTHNPPKNAKLVALSGMDGWSQVVEVHYVDDNLLTSAVPDTQLEPTTRITVTVNRQGRFVYKTSWIAASSG